jgi:hypothetical protein
VVLAKGAEERLKALDSAGAGGAGTADPKGLSAAERPERAAVYLGVEYKLKRQPGSRSISFVNEELAKTIIDNFRITGKVVRGYLKFRLWHLFDFVMSSVTISPKPETYWVEVAPAPWMLKFRERDEGVCRSDPLDQAISKEFGHTRGVDISLEGLCEYYDSLFPQPIYPPPKSPIEYKTIVETGEIVDWGDLLGQDFFEE